MSMDKGLKASSTLARHRNVLTRNERVDALKDLEKWQDAQSVFGLPKVANRKVTVKKEKATPAAAGAEGAEGAPAAEGAAPAAEAAKPGKDAKKGK